MGETTTDPRHPLLPSFARGTLIETDSGPMPIEALRPGDLIRTADNGLRPLRGLVQGTGPGTGEQAPVGFAPGALGNYRWLLVAPGHRMLLTEGQGRRLVPAQDLVDGRVIKTLPRPCVAWVHMMLDHHEIVFAEGIASECLHPATAPRGRLLDQEIRIGRRSSAA